MGASFLWFPTRQPGEEEPLAADFRVDVGALSRWTEIVKDKNLESTSSHGQARTQAGFSGALWSGNQSRERPADVSGQRWIVGRV